MGTIFSENELIDQLNDLRSKRDLIQKNRVAILKKYTRKATQEQKEQETNLELHQVELQIENVERKLDVLF